MILTTIKCVQVIEEGEESDEEDEDDVPARIPMLPIKGSQRGHLGPAQISPRLQQLQQLSSRATLPRKPTMLPQQQQQEEEEESGSGSGGPAARAHTADDLIRFDA